MHRSSSDLVSPTGRFFPCHLSITTKLISISATRIETADSFLDAFAWLLNLLLSPIVTCSKPVATALNTIIVPPRIAHREADATIGYG